jgi:hypothetical protein
MPAASGPAAAVAVETLVHVINLPQHSTTYPISHLTPFPLLSNTMASPPLDEGEAFPTSGLGFDVGVFKTYLTSLLPPGEWRAASRERKSKSGC